MKREQEVAARDHAKKVAAERAAGEEKKRLVKQEEQARRAEGVLVSQGEAARILRERQAAAKTGLSVCVEEYVKATT